MPHDNNEAEEHGAACAEWLHELMRSGAFEAARVRELLRQPAHGIRALIHAHSVGPQGRLSRARLTATGVVRRGDPNRMWMYTTGGPPEVIEFLEQSAGAFGSTNPWVVRAHKWMRIRWEELEASQVPEQRTGDEVV